MCGIVGIVSRDRRPVEPGPLLERLHHRGPDSNGWQLLSLSQANVCLGQTRLAILDLSPAGHQPMASHDDRWWITFNGEIYNHLAIRSDQPGPFRGHSDTETLVEALALWGLDRTLPLLNGMFAFGAVDTVTEQFYLVRDPFGIKPLYYTHLPDGGLAFASEARALKPLLAERPAVDPDALQTFLSLRYLPSPETMWTGIHRLPPGTVLAVDLRTGTTTMRRFIVPTTERYTGSFEEASEAYHRVLSEAVHRQMLSDVPVGVLLSGGVDSALVAALAKEKNPHLPTYSVGFGPGHPECELSDAAESARVLGLPNIAVTVTPERLWEVLEDVLESVEEPLGTTSILPMWDLVRRASEDVTVVLTGQGSDEPWGGYTRYQAEVLRPWLPFAPALGSLHLERLATGSPEWVERALRCMPLKEPNRRFLEAYALFTTEERQALTGRGSSGGSLQAITSWLEWLGGGELESVEQMMRIDCRLNLADDLLLYGDKIAMASSLEARVPMLDLEVVRFIESLPRAYRVGLRRGKHLHKRMAQRYLPASLVNRPKRGFQVPFGTWSRGPWRKRVEETLLDPGAPHWSLLHRPGVEALWREHLTGRRDLSRKLFALLMLTTWWRKQVKD